MCESSQGPTAGLIITVVDLAEPDQTSHEQTREILGQLCDSNETATVIALGSVNQFKAYNISRATAVLVFSSSSPSDAPKISTLTLGAAVGGAVGLVLAASFIALFAYWRRRKNINTRGEAYDSQNLTDQ